jgi:predicted ArsR family transcriptional regulator
MAGLASLAEPTRRALYLYVQAQESAVSRDEAAAAVGVPRHTAKFHLDKLASDGLLEIEFARRTGRSGPGAGRPAKLYRPATRELAVAVPERRYEVAGHLMARAISGARSHLMPVTEALDQAARDHGRMLANRARAAAGEGPSHSVLLHAVRQVLDEEGYHTSAGPDGLTLANCPFRALAAEHTDTICAMNLGVMKGLLSELSQLRLAPMLHPATRGCCVRLAAQDTTMRDSPPGTHARERGSGVGSRP